MRIQRSTKTTHLQKHLRRCEGEIHLPQVPHLLQKDVHDATNAVYDIAQQQSDKAADKCEKKSSKCSGSAHALSICCIRRSAYVPMMSTLAACDGRVFSLHFSPCPNSIPFAIAAGPSSRPRKASPCLFCAIPKLFFHRTTMQYIHLPDGLYTSGTAQKKKRPGSRSTYYPL